jgi:hypothetical protein
MSKVDIKLEVGTYVKSSGEPLIRDQNHVDEKPASLYDEVHKKTWIC